MASSSATRSAFRSCSALHSAFRFASEVKSSRSPFRLVSYKPLSYSTVRCPAELSFYVETMPPYHTATSSTIMTSMLSVSSCFSGWLPEDRNDDL